MPEPEILERPAVYLDHRDFLQRMAKRSLSNFALNLQSNAEGIAETIDCHQRQQFQA